MVRALYLIALLMVLGGAVAIVQGVLILAFSSGSTLVISGVILTTGGFGLAGLAALIGRVERIAAALALLADRAEAEAEAPADAAAPEAGGPDPEPPPVRQPEPPPARPAVDAPPRPRVVPPKPIPVSNPVPQPAASGPAPVAGGLRGTLDAAPPVPAASSPVPAPPAEPAVPTVAGSYQSGGNTYVMYSDGTIRAETPNGQFRFKTVDELKAFIAAGGERRA